MLKSLRCWLQFLNAMLSHLLLVLCIVGFSHSINSSPGFRNGGDDRKNLIVGEELWKETIPLQLGSRVYELHGLKSHTWYEVKISYPASIPASFTIQLKKDDSDPGMNRVVRRLLNTEKLIFKSDVILDSNQSKLCVLVRVEPEGVVAIPNVEERKDITFNIVCDELLLGIPHKAWWVVVFVLLCLGVAFILPHFLPSYLLLRDRRRETLNQSVAKES
ncbi:GPI-Mannosyltransferase II co-activator, Pga [Salix suchowensis]|nr:GPI-Mannosyltransferase II co-activator, Pga [Salix suchowensis]